MDNHPDLPGVFGTISPLIDHHGYLAIALVVLLANICLPVPAEAAVVTGAVFASYGHLDPTAVAVIATIAAIAGSSIGYVIGARTGHRLLLRYGARFGITKARLDRVEQLYVRRGVAIVVLGRFLPFLRRWGGVTAGLSEMPWHRFEIANVIGAAGWATAWVSIGNQAGDHLDTISRFAGGRSGLIVLLVVAGAAVAAAVAYRHRTPPAQPAEAVSLPEDAG